MLELLARIIYKQIIQGGLGPKSFLNHPIILQSLTTFKLWLKLSLL